MKRVLFIALVVISNVALAQNTNLLWKSNTVAKARTSSAAALPQKSLYDLDLTALQQILVNAPVRMVNARTSTTMITLPNADGVFESFRVYDNPVMDPALAARYPQIKSYLAEGVDSPGARVYFSFSPLGFKSMALYPGKPTVFIEPVSADKETYTVYRKSDYKTALSRIECSVIDDAVSSIASGADARPNADDAKLRTFRLALSCTGEYTAYFGGTKALALAGMNNTLTRCNGIFEADFGLRLVLIATNDNVIYTSSSTDPYSDATSMSSWNSQLQSTLTSVIGEANYDIGHLLGATGGGGNAGCIGCVCNSGSKGSGYTSPSNGIPVGDNFDIDYVAHEIGHQLGANHTYTHVTEGTSAQMEPGSGSTIMSYAGITTKDIQRHSDPYFHAISIQQVTNNIKIKTCPTLTNTGNSIPVVNAGLDYTIPQSTPFMLTGTASDANGDALTYAWEEMDLGTAATSTPTSTATAGPTFRSYIPTTSPTRYFPRMATVLTGLTTTAGTEIPWEVMPTVSRTMNFRLTVRDHRAGGPSNNSDDAIVTVNAAAGPFLVTAPNTAVSYSGGTTQTITWNVAGTTANGVNCANVNILLSTDGGLTFPTTLLSGTANDGSENVVIPNTAGTANRIMIKGSNHIFFDVSNVNFSITTGTVVVDTVPPAVVTTLAASGTTTASTNLTWTPTTDNIGVTTYDVYQNGVLKTSSALTTVSVTGLSAGTSYNYYVIAKDAAGNASPASNTAIVTTLSVDSVAPSASVLSASATTTTTTNLGWTAATDNVGVTGYNVYQNGIFKATTSSNSYVVTGLTASTTYTFYVVARDTAGNSSASSNIATVTTLSLADTTAPSTSTLSASGTTTSTTNLSWTASTDNVGVTGYSIYQNGVFKATVSGNSYAVTGLTALTTYNFYIVARDAAGNFSASSNTATVTTLSLGDVSPPSTPTLTASGTTSSTTNLSWTTATDNIGVTGYSVYLNGVLKTTTSSTSYAVTSLSALTTYSFYVIARDAAGNSSASSNIATVTTLSIVKPYCIPAPKSSAREYINKVQLGAINNLSGNNGGYANFTTISTNLALGSNNVVSITPAWSGTIYSEAYRIWIDFNKDGDFDDSGELVLSQSKNRLTVITGTIAVPSTAVLGSTRMRVAMKFNAFPSSCESFNNGEVEDYSVNITASGRFEEEESTARLDFKLYPNPVKGEILNISSLDSPTTFRIFNLLGQELINNAIEGDTIYVGTLPSGTYLIEVSNGSSVLTKRFIKQ